VPIAATDRGTPLVLVGESADRRVAVVTIDPKDLEKSAAFPVLAGNLLEWLARPADGEARGPGRAALSPGTTSVVGPDGRPVKFLSAGDRATTTFSSVGLYTVEAGGSKRRVAVNAGDPVISNVSRTSLPPGADRPVGESGRPWWLYALVVAFVMLLVEWGTWQRRITV
jgi:hypothetical protein